METGRGKLFLPHEALMEADSSFLRGSNFDESHAFFYEHNKTNLCAIYLAYSASVTLTDRYIFIIDVGTKRVDYFLSYYIPPPNN
ncbi:MAG: hypothetical protein AAF587_02265 [Bacteroidota bacterium]